MSTTKFTFLIRMTGDRISQNHHRDSNQNIAVNVFTSLVSASHSYALRPRLTQTPSSEISNKTRHRYQQ